MSKSDKISAVGAVKRLIDMSLPVMRANFPIVMNVCLEGVEFKQPSVSPSYFDIRDINSEHPKSSWRTVC